MKLNFTEFINSYNDNPINYLLTRLINLNYDYIKESNTYDNGKIRFRFGFDTVYINSLNFSIGGKSENLFIFIEEMIDNTGKNIYDEFSKIYSGEIRKLKIKHLLR